MRYVRRHSARDRSSTACRACSTVWSSTLGMLVGLLCSMIGSVYIMRNVSVWKGRRRQVSNIPKAEGATALLGLLLGFAEYAELISIATGIRFSRVTSFIQKRRHSLCEIILEALVVKLFPLSLEAKVLWMEDLADGALCLCLLALHAVQFGGSGSEVLLSARGFS